MNFVVWMNEIYSNKYLNHLKLSLKYCHAVSHNTWCTRMYSWCTRQITSTLWMYLSTSTSTVLVKWHEYWVHTSTWNYVLEYTSTRVHMYSCPALVTIVLFMQPQFIAWRSHSSFCGNVLSQVLHKFVFTVLSG